jgi:hypothetical protein
LGLRSYLTLPQSRLSFTLGGHYFHYVKIWIDFMHDNNVHYTVHYLEMIYEKDKS